MRLTTLLLPIVLASTAGAQSVETEIRAEVTRYVAAINSGNAAAVAALYLESPATSTVGDGQIQRGWRQIAGVLQQVYQAVGSIRMTSDSVSVAALGDAAGIAVLRYRWVFGASSTQAVTGAMTLVYTRTSDGWRVVHDHTSTLQSPIPNAGVMTALGVATESGPAGPNRQTTPCRVVRITDGDGIVCDRIGRVRLIGVDTPELDQKPYGEQSARALGTMIRVGTQVQLEPDVEARDRYGRVLAYVWRDSTLINWRLVRDGWAVLLTYPPNVQYVDALAEAERRARDEGKGLWATGGFGCTPRDHRARRCD